jgi:hypothetical protein
MSHRIDYNDAVPAAMKALGGVNRCVMTSGPPPEPVDRLPAYQPDERL